MRDMWCEVFYDNIPFLYADKNLKSFDNINETMNQTINFTTKTYCGRTPTYFLNSTFCLRPYIKNVIFQQNDI